MITIVKDYKDFEQLQQRWDELFDLCRNATPYQSFLFNKITWDVWHEAEDKLYIICFSQSEGSKLDAIIPCFINNEGELHIIDYQSDFCDGIIPDEYVEKYSMYREICNHILADDEIKTVCFNNLKSDCRLLAYLYAFGEHSSVKAITGYTVIRMTRSDKDRDFVDAIKNCNSTQRTKLRKQLRHASGLGFMEYNYPMKYPEKETREITDYMVTHSIRSREYFNDRFFDYYHTLYESGLLKIYTHLNNSQAVAEKFFLVDNKSNEYISWITLYKGKQDNSRLILASLEKMYSEGFYNFNFARGVYAYKLSDFHPEIHTLNQLRIFKTQQEALRHNIKEAITRENAYLRQKAYIKLANIKHKIFK